jgi:hypothetical protein
MRVENQTENSSVRRLEFMPRMSFKNSISGEIRYFSSFPPTSTEEDSVAGANSVADPDPTFHFHAE